MRLYVCIDNERERERERDSMCTIERERKCVCVCISAFTIIAAPLLFSRLSLVLSNVHRLLRN